MKRYSKYLLVLGVGALTLTSCNLDEVPTTNVVVKDGQDFIESERELNMMRTGIHASFRGTMYGQPVIAEEVMLDGFNATVDFGNNYGSIHRTDDSFTASDYDTKSLWDVHYNAIKNYNVFIKEAEAYAKQSEKPTANTIIALGEAHFYRAYSYLQLVRHFAKDYDKQTATKELGVPLVLVYNQEEKPARATVQQVYDQIKADLDIAAQNLASVKGVSESKTPTIDAVRALMSRYYLDVEDYVNAANYSDMLIKSKAYKLSENEDEMASEYRNDKASVVGGVPVGEPIMQLAGSLSENGSGTNTVYTLAEGYPPLATEYGLPPYYFTSYFLPSQKLLDLYEESDLRNLWFTSGTASYLGGSLTVGSFITFIKYLGNPELNSDGVPNSRHLVKPFLISEMYLINAEANLRKGDAAAAKKALNKLQSARQASETEATEDELDNEWFKETVGEGLRMSYLKRAHRGYSARVKQRGKAANFMLSGASYDKKAMTADDKHFVWPIPTYEIKVNAKLVQNEGY